MKFLEKIFLIISVLFFSLYFYNEIFINQKTIIYFLSLFNTQVNMLIIYLFYISVFKNKKSISNNIYIFKSYVLVYAILLIILNYYFLKNDFDFKNYINWINYLIPIFFVFVNLFSQRNNKIFKKINYLTILIYPTLYLLFLNFYFKNNNYYYLIYKGNINTFLNNIFILYIIIILITFFAKHLRNIIIKFNN